MECRMQNVSIAHAQEEYITFVMKELHNSILTEAEQKNWADVLDATVTSISNGGSAINLELDNVSADRLQQFISVLLCYKQDLGLESTDSIEEMTLQQ